MYTCVIHKKQTVDKKGIKDFNKYIHARARVKGREQPFKVNDVILAKRFLL